MANALEEFGPIFVQDIKLGLEVGEDSYLYDLTAYFVPESVDETR